MELDKREVNAVISTARACLSSAQDDIKPAIVQAGAALEKLVASLPEELNTLAEPLQACLNALQAIYQESIPDIGTVLSKTIEILASTEQLLAGNADVEANLLDTAQTLQQILTSEGESVTEPTPNSEDCDVKADCLDDVAALLVQADPQDEDELRRISAALKKVFSEVELSSNARELVASAIHKLDHASQSAGVSEDLLTEIAGILEAAMEIEADQSVEGPIAAEDTQEPQCGTGEESNPQETEASSSAESSLLPEDFDASLVADFVTECSEYIEEAEAGLLALETDPSDAEAVNKVFRAFHTIKGTSAFLGLNAVSELAHKAENLLSRVRDGEIQYGGVFADLTLRAADMLKALIQGVQAALSGQEAQLPEGYAELCRLLADPDSAGALADSIGEVTPPRVGDLIVAEGAATREEVEAAAAEKGSLPIGEALIKRQVASVADVAKAIRTQKQLSPDAQTKESFIRVRTDRLDKLIDTVGEIVIAHSMVAQDETVVLGRHHELSKKVAHLGKIVRDLQQQSMSMRMVPLKSTFQKMARVVRDLAHKSGKLVDFITEGEDTELDRYMVELINDPLIHMVRNAVDHGIEPPDVRAANGKPRKGTVRLAAYHASGNVVIEMQDDGKGLNREKILEKAIAKGLVSADKNLADADVFSLIFEPGFSTADKVTDVSGRGVGLDVVKRNIEAMHGRIEVSSQLGEGTTFVLRLPLTMAVTEGMLVKVGPEQFIMPTVNIRLSFRPNAQAITTVAGKGEMVLVQGKSIPMFRLYELFEITGAIEDPTQGLLIVVDDGDRGYALLVDEILGQQSVVAKSLGYGIRHIKGISGGAILGDGRVGLILDPQEIAVAAKQMQYSRLELQTTVENAA
ncbi:MAG: chemotaxis protein CheA [Armatimonadota bacterium]|nr:chemotaxis protein CheA [Armatimonadota bacterium]